MLSYPRRWTALLAGLIVVLALALAAPQALAQSSPATTVQVVGVITAYEPPTTFTVNGLSVDASTAEITVTLDIGVAVHVEGTLLDDGSILATEVQAADSGPLPDEIELHGTLESLTATEAVVNGLTFDVTTAQVQPGLAVGDPVTVHASLDALTGTWIAREIALFVPATDPAPGNGNGPNHDDNYFELVGTLDAIDGTSIVVSGLTIDISTAEIQGTLTVGLLVKVELAEVDGALVALEVKVATAGDQSQSGSGDDNVPGAGSANSGNGSGAMCRFQIEAGSANLRSGPGTGYDIVGYALQNQAFTAMQIDASGTWLQIQLQNQEQAWIALSAGQLDDCPSGMLGVSGMQFRGENGGMDDSPGHDQNDDNSSQQDMGNHHGDDHGDNHGGGHGDD